MADAWALAPLPQRELRGEQRKLFIRVRQALWDYEPLRASHAEIVIHVEGRSVRLAGRTRTLPQKIMAETLAARVPDVEHVTSEILADPEVVRAVADALALDARTAPYVLRVDASHGVVALYGQVPDATTREAALEIASRVPSVAAVRDRLTVGGRAQAPFTLARASDPAAELEQTSALDAAAAAARAGAARALPA